jgi:hypothetical protein
VFECIIITERIQNISGQIWLCKMLLGNCKCAWHFARIKDCVQTANIKVVTKMNRSFRKLNSNRIVGCKFNSIFKTTFDVIETLLWGVDGQFFMKQFEISVKFEFSLNLMTNYLDLNPEWIFDWFVEFEHLHEWVVEFCYFIWRCQIFISIYWRIMINHYIIIDGVNVLWKLSMQGCCMQFLIFWQIILNLQSLYQFVKFEWL